MWLLCLVFWSLAHACLISDVDDEPTRIADSIVCPQFSSLSCCPLAAQAAIQRHQQRIERTAVGSDPLSACHVNAIQLLCFAFCSVEQVLAASVLPAAPDDAVTVRRLVFHVDANYADDLWRSCRLRCDRRSNAAFEQSVRSAALFLRLFDADDLTFNDHGVNLTLVVAFVRRNETELRPALLASPTPGRSLARSPCGPDDVPCGGNASTFASALPSCILPTPPPRTEPTSVPPTPPAPEPTLFDPATIVTTLIGAAVGLCSACGVFIALLVCKRRAENSDDENRIEDLYAYPMPERRRVPPGRVNRRPPRAPAEPEAAEADELQSAESAGGGEACDVCASALEINDAVSAFALWCARCQTARRGVCVRCGRTGRVDELYCRGCHRILPGMLPAATSSSSGESGADCAICLEALATAAAVRVPCGHQFHRLCFTQNMLSDSGKHTSCCPLCKAQFRKNRQE